MLNIRPGTTCKTHRASSSIALCSSYSTRRTSKYLERSVLSSQCTRLQCVSKHRVIFPTNVEYQTPFSYAPFSPEVFSNFVCWSEPRGAAASAIVTNRRCEFITRKDLRLHCVVQCGVWNSAYPYLEVDFDRTVEGGRVVQILSCDATTFRRIGYFIEPSCFE